MKMSCNGCRILRKGCDENCLLKPCLDWIQNPDSQSNATLFLAKFYGRAGLLNLINAGPPHLRPAIFKSLLYDACGRMINPIHGSVGLMWTGKWDHCQAAVDAVLSGLPIMQLPFDTNDDHDGAAPHPIMPFEVGDIRHNSTRPNGVRQVRNRTQPRIGRAKAKSNFGGELDGHSTYDSVSGETVELSLVNRADPKAAVKSDMQSEESDEIVLELTLGVNPTVLHNHSS